MRILVTGGTGVLGRPAVDRLVGRGHTVRLLSRHAGRDAQDWEQGVEPFQAQIGDADALRGAVEGCQAVLHIAGIVAEDPPGTTFDRINVGGTRNLLAECARAGAPRFVYVSSLGADRGSSDYHRSKLAAERLVREYAGDWLILRPGNVYGPGDEVISLLMKMVRSLPAIPVVGAGDQPFQPIWADDAGLALALAVEERRSGEVLELAGDDVVTTNEILDRLEELTGRHPARFPVPGWAAMAGTEMAETVGLQLRVSSDQLAMLREGNAISPGVPNALREVYGIVPTPLADGLAMLADGLPERMPDDGTGALKRHRYWADIRGSALDAEGLMRVVRHDFRSLADPRFIRVGAEPGSDDQLEEGATLTLGIPVRGNVQVRVEEVKPTEITAVTLEGHPLSGTVRMISEALGPDLVRFEVRTYTRASSLPDRIVMFALGESIKGAAWISLVDAVVLRSRGSADGGVHSFVEELDPEACADLESWVEAMVRRRKARAHAG
jgi:nucleoside-diphosphate-sugar epimerase